MSGISGISGITPSMDSRDIRLAARGLGVRLTVTKDDELLSKPDSLLTPELREAIRANRDDLLYDVLLADALRFVAVECDEAGADPNSVPAAHEDAITAAYLARDWTAFRTAIREFARAGRREAARARGLALPTASPASPTTMKGAS